MTDHRIPIEIDLNEAPETPEQAMPDPATVAGIHCAATARTVEQLQRAMRGQGLDLATALANLVDMGSFMFDQLAPPNPATAWVYPGQMPDPVRETLRLLGFTEVRLGQ